jgi:hypothetical protein
MYKYDNLNISMLKAFVCFVVMTYYAIWREVFLCSISLFFFRSVSDFRKKQGEFDVLSGKFSPTLAIILWRFNLYEILDTIFKILAANTQEIELI